VTTTGSFINKGKGIGGERVPGRTIEQSRLLRGIRNKTYRGRVPNGGVPEIYRVGNESSGGGFWGIRLTRQRRKKGSFTKRNGEKGKSLVRTVTPRKRGTIQKAVSKKDRLFMGDRSFTEEDSAEGGENNVKRRKKESGSRNFLVGERRDFWKEACTRGFRPAGERGGSYKILDLSYRRIRAGVPKPVKILRKNEFAGRLQSGGNPPTKIRRNGCQVSSKMGGLIEVLPLGGKNTANIGVGASERKGNSFYLKEGIF